MLPASPPISLIALGFFLMSTPPPDTAARSEFGGEGYARRPGDIPGWIDGAGWVPNIVWRRIRACIGEAVDGAAMCFRYQQKIESSTIESARKLNIVGSWQFEGRIGLEMSSVTYSLHYGFMCYG